MNRISESLTSLLFVSLLAACGSGDSELELPDWSDGFPTGGDAGPGADGGPSGTGTLVVRPNGDLPYDYRFGQTEDPGADCEVDLDSANFTERSCRLEGKELDLYVHGFGYTVDIPRGACDYLAITNYMYEAWQVGVGPALVHFKVDEAGNFIEDVTGSLNGEPFCEFDHKSLQPNNPEAPNCCFGSYLTQITVVDDQGGETDLAPTGPEDWGGGKVGECYAGAAFTSTVTALDEVTGLPLTIIVPIDTSEDSSFSVGFDAPIDKPESSSITLVNFADPLAELPLGLQGSFAVPEYQFECLDTAHEVRARFKFTLREWDEESEFDADGDPDSGQKENKDDPQPLENNNSGSPINDYFDWDDFQIEEIDYVESLD